ncbi:phage cell wall peptidase, NLP/P60 family [Brucella vulpis]|uniref:C40 family peptidase n=1 Tax=Brucella TaxID=234 RepID=UPI00073A9E40|nr:MULTISPECIES: NlpC/P60 family protein [unclassified Brucella]CUW42861.1 phage cell wall peptidase, NLP/P60 family [Brucella vulpis]QGA57550.1 peptidase P60 [Brucella sp. 2280]UWF67090.1 NlpC/P60 family protein [Brucella sp. 1315]UWF70216.1 NlpC/P60 family protein [Brucella sp. 2594]CAB4326847.1 NlpC/P60 family phage cell wall peptidase [Brucella sp. 191011898]
MMIAERVLAEAHRWIGTPYRHGASTLGVSCDCLGLVRGIWRALYGMEPENPGVYAPDWAEVSQGDPMLEAAARYMARREEHAPQPGDLLVFRWKPGFAAKHMGIMAREGRFIHAYQGHGVLASALVPQWRRRMAGIFLFPEPKV